MLTYCLFRQILSCLEGYSMNKTIKVLLADTSDFFGVPCAAALRSHEMDVIQVEKDGR